MRDGDDLVTVVNVPAPLAALGTTVQVPTVTEGDVDLEIPPGTQPHETFRVRGKGMPSLRGRRRGDLQVVVDVIVPRHLSREQRELMEQLADSLGEHNIRTDDGVLRKLRRAFGA
jgi:molecular chaperone DnaJ